MPTPRTPTALACVAATCFAITCATAPERTAPRRDVRPAQKPDARPNLGRWDDFERLSTFRRVARVRSQHLGGGDGELLANDAAGSYPASAPTSPGAILAERHFAPGGSEPIVVFAMVKRQPGFDPEGGDWEYLVVAPTGEIEARGPVPSCARCHAEAPSKPIFGPPRGFDAGPD